MLVPLISKGSLLEQMEEDPRRNQLTQAHKMAVKWQQQYYREQYLAAIHTKLIYKKTTS